MSANGMVRPCSCPASERRWQGLHQQGARPCPRQQAPQIAVIGIDIGKNSFHVVGHDERGAIVLRQKWSRGQIEARLVNLPSVRLLSIHCRFSHASLAFRAFEHSWTRP